MKEDVLFHLANAAAEWLQQNPDNPNAEDVRAALEQLSFSDPKAEVGLRNVRNVV